MASSFSAGEQKAFARAAAPSRAASGGLPAWLEPARGRWVLFVPVALGAGILLWFVLPFTVQRQAAVLMGLAVALGGLALSGLLRRCVVAGGLLLAAGLVVADVRSAQVATPKLYHRLTAAELVGTVERAGVTQGGERGVLLVRRDASSVDPAIRVRLSVPGGVPPGVGPGARISVPAVLGPVPGPVLPGAYDPARRAWFEGVSATGRATGPARLLAPARGGWLAARRAALGRHIQAGLGGDAGAIAVALVVGEQGQVRPALIDAMRVSGLAHLLTVSGFHIAVVVGGALWLLRRALALWPWLALRVSVRRLAAVGAGLAGSFYALLSGADVPAVRAAITAWIVLVALMLGRDPLSLRLLAFAAVLILAARPEAVLNPSFQLSFAAVTVLVVVVQSGERLFRVQPEDGVLVRGGRLLAATLLTGIAIELVLMPIAMAHFGRAGAYGAIANLAAIPLTSFVIMPLLGMWLALSALGLGGLVAWALVPALDALAGLATLVAGWPGAVLAVPAMPGLAFALIVAGGLILGLLAGRVRWAGAPLLLAGVLAALLTPRPDLFVGADGRQVAVVAEDRLYTLRGHRGGYVPSLWAERAAAVADGRLADLPGARCTDGGCAVPVGDLALLALTEEEGLPPGLARLCAAADVVTAPGPLPADCGPRWLQLDRAALRRSGAVAIESRQRQLDSVAARAGDHVWSPSALPGERPRLLGGPAWTGVVAE